MRALAIAVCAAAALVGAAWWYSPARGSAVTPEPALAVQQAQPLAVPLESLETEGAQAARSPATRPARRPSPAERSRAAVRALAEGSTTGAEWEREARSRAAGLDAAELARLSADAGRPAKERLAAAELLRHVPGAELPPAALALLRESWSARETDPALAAAAVRALGAFGDADDRAALLDEAVQSSGLALAGISAARGDEAARELAQLAIEPQDARRSELALAALASIASAPQSRLTPRARLECADALGTAFSDRREARRRCALVALGSAR